MSTQDTASNREWAKFINRLTDWLLPVTDGDENSPPLPRLQRYAPTFLGAAIWISGMMRLYDYKEPDIFAGTMDILLFFSAIGLSSVLVIAESFKRGTPLRFFLRGLFIPTVVTSMIKLALIAL